MTTLLRHLIHQGPVLKALLNTLIAAKQQAAISEPKKLPPMPGDVKTATLPPRPLGLIRDYVKHVDGNPKKYAATVPPHLFPQWTFPIGGSLLVDLPYPLMRTVNGGCRLDIHQPIPQGEPLEVSAQLENIDDNGRRAVLTQKLVTGTRTAPNAIEARMYAIVPLRKQSEKKPESKKLPARVPEDAKLVAQWRLASNSGLQFAALTGDFNPIHWIPAVAKANGFKNTILHGFSTMARCMEGLEDHYLLGSGTLKWIDVQFTRPLVLPAQVGLFIRIENEEKQVYVGDACGGPAYMKGTFDVVPNDTKEAYT